MVRTEGFVSVSLAPGRLLIRSVTGSRESNPHPYNHCAMSDDLETHYRIDSSLPEKIMKLVNGSSSFTVRFQRNRIKFPQAFSCINQSYINWRQIYPI